jgi:putative transposase
MNVKTHTGRLFPTVSQKEQLLKMMRLRNIIWNKLLSIREKTYQDTKSGMTDFDMINLLPGLKKEHPEFANYNSKAAQVIACQIGQAYRSFFKLLKNGDFTARPPGIIDEDKVVSITFRQNGWLIKDNKILFSKMDSPILFKSKEDFAKLHIKEVRIKLINNKWLCDIVEEYEDQRQENKSNRTLAMDLGLKKLATGIDSDGKVIILHNKAKKVSKYFGKQIAKVSKQLSKKTKDSNQYKHLQNVRRKLYRKKNSQVKQTLHIQSKKLANMNYQTIVLGDLSVKELMSKRKKLNKELNNQQNNQTNNQQNNQTNNHSNKRIRKSFAESSVDTFRQFLTYKCKGRTKVEEIDESNTTQLNCLTGEKFKKKVELKDRKVQLSDRIVIDRDLNSAINIFKRWESYHLAAMIPPLDFFGVLEKNNLFQEASQTIICF